MALYLDSKEYYATRREEINWAILRRKYYAGHPYTPDPCSRHQNEELWRNLMQPTEAFDDHPDYVDNVAKQRIDVVVGDVLPANSRLVFKNPDSNEPVPVDTIDELLSELVDFGYNYGRGIKGFFSWARSVLRDAAQTGDCALLPRWMPDDKRCRLASFPYEAWDAEVDPVTSEIDRYRIEYAYVAADRKTYYRRWDILRDRIIRYSDEKSLASLDQDTPPQVMQAIALDPVSMYKPPEMKVDTTRSETLDKAEQTELRQLGDFLLVPVIWQRECLEAYRGSSELTLPHMRAIDDEQRMMGAWKESAVKLGNQPLSIIDADAGSEVGSNSNEIRPDKAGPGAVLNLVSNSDEHQGKVTYPDNQPAGTAHRDVIDRMRRTVSADVPLLDLDMQDMANMARMSGFAKDLMQENHQERVEQIRDDVLDNGILKALRIVIKILAARGMLPDGISPKVKIMLVFGKQTMSPDEKLKMLTAAVTAQNMGAPPQEIINLWPQDPLNPDELAAALQEQRDMSRQLEALALQPAPTADEEPPLDNRAK